MPKLTALLCSEGVAVDLATKQMSIFNVIDQISAPSFPIGMGSLCVVVFLERDAKAKAQYQGSLTIRNNGKDLGSMVIPIDFKATRKNRSIAKFQGVPIQEPGFLEILFSLDGKVLGTSQIEVAQVTPEKLQATTVEF